MSQPDLLLYTDGSGHQDGFGGYAAFVKTPDGLVERFCMGAMSETSVDRAEFTALIEGLRLAMETWQRFPQSSRLIGGDVEWIVPKIRWTSDREALVLSVKKVYDRSNCPDLWAAFEYFERIADIEAVQISEVEAEALREFIECDLHASTGRVLMKSYYVNTPLTVDEKLLPKKKSKKNGTDEKTSNTDNVTK